MARSRPLPDDLGSAFGRADAARRQIPGGRLRRQDIVHPFTGVSTTAPPADVRGLCRAYAVRVKPGQFFSHPTAARLRGLSLPLALETERDLHVAAAAPADAPHARGIRGHRLVVPVRVEIVEGPPVASEPDVLCQLGSMLHEEDLLVVVDELLNRTQLD